jgi:hypothetical protein
VENQRFTVGCSILVWTTMPLEIGSKWQSQLSRVALRDNKPTSELARITKSVAIARHGSSSGETHFELNLSRVVVTVQQYRRHKGGQSRRVWGFNTRMGIPALGKQDDGR